LVNVQRETLNRTNSHIKKGYVTALGQFSAIKRQ